ncbi:MAG: porin family protein [Lentisphaerae bacterium]|nr:porin family protein [Lentisphaerota bacterium]
MQKILSRISLLTVAAGLLLSAGQAGATAMDAPWYVSLNAGMIRFEGDEAVKSGFLSSLRLGYDYSPAWSFEGVLNYAPRLDRNEVYNYETGEPIPRKGLIDADHAAAFGAAVDALFHLRNMDNQQFDPYLIGGIGFMHLTEEREFRERTDVTLRPSSTCCPPSASPGAGGRMCRRATRPSAVRWIWTAL